MQSKSIDSQCNATQRNQARKRQAMPRRRVHDRGYLYQSLQRNFVTQSEDRFEPGFAIEFGDYVGDKARFFEQNGQRSVGSRNSTKSVQLGKLPTGRHPSVARR